MSELKIGMLVTHRESISTDLWRVENWEGNIATLQPISLGATRLQTPLRDVLRYRLKTTDQVFFGEDLVAIKRVVNPRGADYYEYVVDHHGVEKTLKEHQLVVQVESTSPDPLAQLLSLDNVPAAMCRKRVDFLQSYFNATAKSLGIVGYNGARMFPIPHQVGAARYALLFGRPRFILADEVGLGKTIEAGLIVSTIRKYFPEWRTAFFVPESITIQWAFEMFGKFGKSVFRLSDDDEPEEGDHDPGVILPHGHLADWARKETVEILVIDEAHQLLRDNALFDAAQRLSRRAHVVLLLTATPTSDDGNNLTRLLQLVDPAAFERLSDQGKAFELYELQPKVEKLNGLLRDLNSSFDDILAAWEALEVEDDVMIARFLSLKVNSQDLALRHKLIALVTDQYDPRSRVLRYQRKFLAMDNEMAERVEESLTYQPNKEELEVRRIVRQWCELLVKAGKIERPGYLRAASTLIQASHSSAPAVEAWLAVRQGKYTPCETVTADPIRLNEQIIESMEMTPEEETLLEELQMATSEWHRRSKGTDMKARALARLPRYEALLAEIKAMLEDGEPHRILIFTSFECNVRPLYLLLNKAFGKDTEILSLHAEIPWRDREKAAFSFQECPGSAILISDELGGEGRNFQFADAIFHFDLPLAAWMVEQRIGRLDRVGRDPLLDVDSKVIVAEGELDEAIYEFQRDALGVFNESLAPVEDISEDVSRQMLQCLLEKGKAGVQKLTQDLAEYIDQRREKEAKGLERRSQQGMKYVQELSARLNDSQELAKLQKTTIDYTRALGSIVDETRNRVVLTVGSHHPLHAYPGILDEMEGYFDRSSAVRHERLEFFSPGHPFVRKLAQTAVQDNGGRTGFVTRVGIAEPVLATYHRVFLPQEFLEAVREMPEDIQPSILCVAAGNYGTRFVCHLQTASGRVLAEDSEEAKAFHKPLHKNERSLHTGEEIYNYLPKNWETLFMARVEEANTQAMEKAREFMKEGMTEFISVLGEVLTRQFGDEFALEAGMDTLLYSMDPLQVELDSIIVYLPEKG
ncbi:MAG: SNF2-related protein [Sumerlaeia bacterium]